MEEKFKQEPTAVVKVVLFGPESTGKTTLAKALAEHFNTQWVPEYMRTYLEERAKLCELEDLLPISKGQIETENQLAQQANRVLFCDTNLLEIKVYSKVYNDGYVDPLIAKYAVKHQYDLYFLTYIDVPWEADVLRDKPFDRENMFTAFKEALQVTKTPYVVLKGNHQERLKTAIRYVEQLIS